MTETLPKIWNTTLTDHTINYRKIDYHISRPKIDFINDYDRHDPIPRERAPDHIFFNLRDLKPDYKAKTPDLAMIADGILVISEKFRDLLVTFDLGPTQIFEVPLFEYDQKTRYPGRWFILHICAKKQSLIADKSEGLAERGTKGYWRSHLAQQDILAVRADANEGPDLWIDPHLAGRIFVSDRLKSALKPAGIRVLKMPIRPCIVIA